MTEKEQGDSDIICINGSLLYPVHAQKSSFYIYLYQWSGPFDVVLGHSQGACLVVAMDCLKCRPGIQIQIVFQMQVIIVIILILSHLFNYHF